ncbi:MAG TPA: arsenate reductase (glutaredoxin) [Chromatiales bacterium]|nr:arsenate reductase (glutaredoxin) [Chromatiales bacterium]
MQVTIYHNPRCSKSRKTMELLLERGIEPEVIEYLNTPPDAATLARLLEQLGRPIADIMRTGEQVCRDAAEQLQAMDESQQLEWLAQNPQALQRPIVVAGEQARIGRPPESVLEIIGT